MAEAADIPEFDIAPAWGVFLPASTSASIVATLEAWFSSNREDGRHPPILASTHAAPFSGGADALAAFLPKEIEKWKELARLANIQPQ